MLTVMGMLLRKRLILPDMGRTFCGVWSALAASLNVVTLALALLAVRSLGRENIEKLPARGIYLLSHVFFFEEGWAGFKVPRPPIISCGVNKEDDMHHSSQALT